MKARVSAVLRGLARQVEVGGGGINFTCNAVGFALGDEWEARYAAAFGFAVDELDACVPANATELWNSPDIQDIRVLLLCFAAAMDETGDL